MKDLSGTKLQGKYLLNRRIGEGGMGVVYEAENLLIKRVVAVKLLNPQLVSDKEVVERFHREAQAAALIGHHNVVDILDLGFDGSGTPFIVMEYLKGQSLFDILRKRGSPEPKESLEIIFQALSALAAAHAKGVIHRDLKPENIFVTITPTGGIEAKILDFGISKFAHGVETSVPGLTKVGTVMGTPYYMSPEQARGEKDIDARTDIYSIGVILYQLFTGHLPFEEDNYNVLMARLLTEKAAPARTLRPEITIDFERVIMTAMAHDRKERYGRVADLLEALLPFFKGEKYCLSSVKISIFPAADDEGDVQPKYVVEGVPIELSPSVLQPALAPEITHTPTVWSNATRRKNMVPWVAGSVGLMVAIVLAVIVLGQGEGKAPASAPVKPASSKVLKGPSLTPLDLDRVDMRNTPSPATGLAASALPGAPVAPAKPAAAAPSIAVSPKAPAAARAPAPAPAPVPADVLLSVEGAPDSALIWLDGKRRIGTRFNLPAGSGPHTVEIKATGYEPYKETIAKLGDRNQTLTVTMERVAKASQPTKPAKTAPAKPKDKFKRDNPFE